MVVVNATIRKSLNFFSFIFFNAKNDRKKKNNPEDIAKAVMWIIIQLNKAKKQQPLCFSELKADSTLSLNVSPSTPFMLGSKTK